MMGMRTISIEEWIPWLSTPSIDRINEGRDKDARLAETIVGQYACFGPRWKTIEKTSRTKLSPENLAAADAIRRLAPKNDAVVCALDFADLLRRRLLQLLILSLLFSGP
jgi:hypothetical protein